MPDVAQVPDSLNCLTSPPDYEHADSLAKGAASPANSLPPRKTESAVALKTTAAKPGADETRIRATVCRAW